MSTYRRRQVLASLRAAGAVALLFATVAALVMVGIWTTTL